MQEVIGYLLYLRTKISYAVESFEPHADYMEEIGIWKKSGVSYTLQKYLEEKQKKTACHLIPVSYQYKKRLIQEGINENIISVMPCVVNSQKFQFSEEGRSKIRKQLGVNKESTVGIYVGKFGGIYLEDEAFDLFRLSFKKIPSFFLVLLSPMPASLY